MSEDTTLSLEVAATVKRWGKKRGSLIMMLHDIQDQRGYVPRESALELAHAIDVPLAQIYEALTFYHFFRLDSPGKVVVSVCTGTACHLKGADEILQAFETELSLSEGQTASDGGFHLQAVRCVGCCSLAPAVVVNGKTYGKVTPAEVRSIVHEWREKLRTDSLEEANDG